ncbi:hypothetical protein DBQ01_00315 [Lacticaseibacillus rhamnosus]|nr:hypothetical protein B4587_01985 [Lacticaseibacillus rhamnosus]PIN35451.1 hypothetical protein CUC11_03930 [Lacticaseibacillus rhamnosus]PLC34243.1 hypothetical protein C0Q89_02000 [Lacticaseibacillus rhamnosus]PTR97629.1 hypothetical protein DBP95_00300 [Lacticaseibacillus rhamnosus]PTS02856.1 hypothetical protein DBQ01_00315 [Lacticaseibacillus rhamnosus]
MSTFPRFYSHYVISDTPSWLRGGWAGTWWARLRTRKDRGFEARPWSKAEKPTPLKTNFTTEPATAPPALAFYPNIEQGDSESCKLMLPCLRPHAQKTLD